MPTPVSVARQCLTQEAASVLDDAVAVARRRGHAQTTSLHMVSSLLSMPRSPLREACGRTRNNAYSTRVQFKALDLSLGVSLDRLPSSQGGKIEEPPVSNSLMAAIKRSQASQRRQPENYSFYQQQQQQYAACSSSSSSIPIVKVELQNLIISILDDPLVSRVLGEAGFRSCDIKLATLRPGSSFQAHHLFGYCSRYKRAVPPLFLCNLTGNENVDGEGGGRGFNFPFMGCFSGDDNSRRIGEIMVRDKKRSPLLLGVSAGDALRTFLETVQKKVKGILPEGLNELSVVCLKDGITRYLNGGCDAGALELRFEEIRKLLRNVTGAGVLLNLGDLNTLAGNGVGIDRLTYLVSRLSKLLEVHKGKLWLIGAAATNEIHSKILAKFPTIEVDWDLEILPMTSLKFSIGGSYPRSGLMGSFVPLAGFFSMPSETQSSLSNARQFSSRCHLCNEKCEQEVAGLSNGGRCGSVAEQCKSSLPSWLHSAELNAPSSLGSIEGKDGSVLLNAKIAGIQRKWDGICQQCHCHFSKGLTHQHGYQHQRVLGFQVGDGKEDASCDRSNNHSKESSNEPGNKIVSSSISTDFKQSPSLRGHSLLDAQSKANNQSISSKSCGILPVGSNFLHLNDGIKDPKSMYKALVERVGRQEDAINVIVGTITQCQSNASDLQGIGRRSIWINCQGPDHLGKKKVGVALAEILYGSAESLIYINLYFHDEISQANEAFNSQITNKYDITMRGTVVDYLVEKLSRKPSVVLIENIDNADMVVQNRLSQAMKTDRFTDLRGREVTISNCIFLVTTKFTEGSKNIYSEKDILRTRGCLIQILIRFDLNDDPACESVQKCTDVSFMNKRKLAGHSQGADQCGNMEMTTTKRQHKALNSCLDLNLPAEGSEIYDTSSSESESDSITESSRPWLDDFSQQFNQVVFSAFDFNGLADKLINEMTKYLRDVAGSECSLEIEPKVMHQLLAAAYVFGNKKVDDWIRGVLGPGLVVAVDKFSVNAGSTVRISGCEGNCEDLLPSSVVVK